jgi:hypothetical protein
MVKECWCLLEGFSPSLGLMRRRTNDGVDGLSQEMRDADDDGGASEGGVAVSFLLGRAVGREQSGRACPNDCASEWWVMPRWVSRVWWPRVDRQDFRRCGKERISVQSCSYLRTGRGDVI